MYSDKLETHIVELPKAAESEHEETILLKWARFIHAETKEELEMRGGKWRKKADAGICWLR